MRCVMPKTPTRMWPKPKKNKVEKVQNPVVTYIQKRIPPKWAPLRGGKWSAVNVPEYGPNLENNESEKS